MENEEKKCVSGSIIHGPCPHHGGNDATIGIVVDNIWRPGEKDSVPFTHCTLRPDGKHCDEACREGQEVKESIGKVVAAEREEHVQILGGIGPNIIA